MLKKIENHDAHVKAWKRFRRLQRDCSEILWFADMDAKHGYLIDSRAKYRQAENYMAVAFNVMG